MWGWGRPRRDLPAVNYAESDDEEEFALPEEAFNSPLQSPVRPVHTREASPVLLAHPTLNDNVDEVLEEVQYKLHDIAQVEEEIDELSDLLEDTKVGDCDSKGDKKHDLKVGEGDTEHDSKVGEGDTEHDSEVGEEVGKEV